MITPDFDPTILINRYNEFLDPANYERLKQQIEPQVVEWRWATDDMFPLEPLQEYRPYPCKGKWLKPGKEPDYYNMMLHGLDANGKVLIIHIPYSPESYHNGEITERYYIYEEDKINIVQYSDFRLRTVKYFISYSYNEGRPYRQQIINGGSINDTWYYWNNQILEFEEGCEWLSGASVLEPIDINNTFEIKWHGRNTFQYDLDGQLQKIVKQDLSNGEEQLVYLRTRSGESIKELAPVIEDLLVEEIRRIVTNAHITSPAYCMILGYNSEDTHCVLPPFILIGLDEERQRIISEGNEIQYYLWAPDELRERCPEVNLSDPEVLAKCLLFTQLMSLKHSASSGYKILRSVAKRLSSMDWSNILPVTSDFIVFAADNASEIDLMKDMKESVPADKLADLKKRKLL